jgi:hypothetical protein
MAPDRGPALEMLSSLSVSRISQSASSQPRRGGVVKARHIYD